MSKVNQSTLAKTKEWAKHLRPFGKRQQAKAERKAAQKDIKTQKKDAEP